MMIRINKIHEVTMGLRIKNSGRVLFNEELKNHTTYKVGGPAAVLCLPVSREELQEVIRTCNNSLVPVFILGSAGVKRGRCFFGGYANLNNAFAGFHDSPIVTTRLSRWITSSYGLEPNFSATLDVLSPWIFRISAAE